MFDDDERTIRANVDEILSFNEGEETLSEPIVKGWKVLIVDDDEGIHRVTHLLLGQFEYEGLGLDLISAYSEAEAKIQLNNNPDVAVVLLDVVMGNDESGLNLVRYIREVLKNRLIRIVLRTGQPGQAPEKKVIVNYDINDYKLKTELTADKIYVTMVSALRSYKDMWTLEKHKKTLERMIDATTTLFLNRKIPDFIQDVGEQFKNILSDHEILDETKISGISFNIIEGEFLAFSCSGEYAGCEGKLASVLLDVESLDLLQHAYLERTKKYTANRFVAYLNDEKGPGTMFFIRLNREFNDWDRNLIEIFSATIQAAYMNLTLSRDVDSTQRELIYALGELAEARSKETGNHVKRVSEYSKLLGELLELTSQEIELLAIASPVHDIGKLTVPDAILNKPGPLNAEEFEIIKLHASAGHDILSSSNKIILRTAAIIASQHHEKWDGSGYPQGLREEEIHLYGRIVALADVFDALGSDRVYKKAWPIEQIISYMLEQRGHQFDPLLVDIFIKHIDRFIEIKNTF